MYKTNTINVVYKTQSVKKQSTENTLCELNYKGSRRGLQKTMGL